MLKLIIFVVVGLIPALVSALMFGLTKQQGGMVFILLFCIAYFIDGATTYISRRLDELRDEMRYHQKIFGIPPKSTKKEL